MALSALGLGAINAGAGFAESLAQRIFGSGDRKRILRFAEMLKSRMGTDAISPARQQEILRKLYEAGSGERNRMAEGINRRLNLDSGVAQGALAEQAQDQLLGIGANLSLENERMKFQRDRGYDDIIGRIYGGLL